MKKILLIILTFVWQLSVYAQTSPIISKWTLNTTSKTSSWWQNTAASGPPTYSYYTSTDLADVIKVCYTTDSVWVNANGMTNDMGKYLNPGACVAQNYIYRFPRNPSVPTTKTISPKGGAIGLLVNGIPIYGLSNSYSYKHSTSANTNMGGDGIWNVEVYLSEGFVLDTAFGAHPQQQGAYHTHATPWRLYKSTASTVHSPLVGFAFDGNPVYGPYGYSSAMNSSSSVARMKTGYSLRNITTRQTLPYGVALTSSQYGPAVSATYPLGTYCEDYEWLLSNGGDLDKYNGRFCVTPEYPGGTYAYFVTQSSAGVPQFPYYIGIEYYGSPDTKDLVALGNTGTSITFPTSGNSCNGISLGIKEISAAETSSMEKQSTFTIYPNPARSNFTIQLSNAGNSDNTVWIYNGTGEMVYSSTFSSSSAFIDLSENAKSGLYMVYLLDSNGQTKEVQKIMIW